LTPAPLTGYPCAAGYPAPLVTPAPLAEWRVIAALNVEGATKRGKFGTMPQVAENVAPGGELALDKLTGALREGGR
jgi:hypothetical protein